MAKKRKLIVVCRAIKKGKYKGKSVQIGQGCMAQIKPGYLEPYEEIILVKKPSGKLF